MATGETLRTLALALEGTTEAPHFERLAFKAKRIYVTLAGDRKTANFYFTPEEQEMKCAVYPDAFVALDNKWGKQGWTKAILAKLSRDELKAALDTAYVHGAAKQGRGWR
jgi:hypothetical protein